MINHINLTDEKGQVYCCLRNRVVRFDAAHQAKFCGGCRMYNGTAGDNGVQCLWDDPREAETCEVVVTDAAREWASNQARRVQTPWTEWSAGHGFGDTGEQAV